MTELEKSIHDPYPFGNDECPKCLNKTNITMTAKQFNDAIRKTLQFNDAIRKTLFKLSEMNPLSRTRIQRGH